MKKTVVLLVRPVARRDLGPGASWKTGERGGRARTASRTSEVVAKQQAGAINVLIVNGGTEARGPHNILAGHTIMSRATAIDVAKALGNTLVAPVMPIDVGATGVSEGTKTPGGITVSAEIFKGLKLAEIESMAWNGFKNIFVMGDHGGGQRMMKEAAEEMNARCGRPRACASTTSPTSTRSIRTMCRCISTSTSCPSAATAR